MRAGAGAGGGGGGLAVAALIAGLRNLPPELLELAACRLATERVVGHRSRRAAGQQHAEYITQVCVGRIRSSSTREACVCGPPKHHEVHAAVRVGRHGSAPATATARVLNFQLRSCRWATRVLVWLSRGFRGWGEICVTEDGCATGLCDLLF